jgi:hypothetical protein
MSRGRKWQGVNPSQSWLSFEQQAESGKGSEKADIFFRVALLGAGQDTRGFGGRRWESGTILSDLKFLEITFYCPLLQSQRSS